MMKLKYLRIAYCIFALTPVVASAADERAPERAPNVFVYCGPPSSLPYGKNEYQQTHIFFPESEISVKDLIKESWGKYVSRLGDEELTKTKILADFQQTSHLEDEAEEHIILTLAKQSQERESYGNLKKEKFVDYHKTFDRLNDGAPFICFVETSALLSIGAKEVINEYKLSNLIKAEKKRRSNERGGKKDEIKRKNQNSQNNQVNQNSQVNQEIQNDKKWSKIKENPIYITIGGGGTLAIIGVLLYTINKYKSKEPGKKKGTVTKKANDAKGKKQKSK